MSTKIGIFINYNKYNNHIFLNVYYQAQQLALLGYEIVIFLDGYFDNHGQLNVSSIELQTPFPNIILNVINLTNEKIVSITPESFDIWFLHNDPFYTFITIVDAPVIFFEHSYTPSYLFDSDLNYHVWANWVKHIKNECAFLCITDAVICDYDFIYEQLPEKTKKISFLISPNIDNEKIEYPEILEIRKSILDNINHKLVLLIGSRQLLNGLTSNYSFQEYKKIIPNFIVNRSVEKLIVYGSFTKEERMYFQFFGVHIANEYQIQSIEKLIASSNFVCIISQETGLDRYIKVAEVNTVPVIAFSNYDKNTPYKEMAIETQAIGALDINMLDICSANKYAQQQRSPQSIDLYSDCNSLPNNIDKLISIVKNCISEHASSYPVKRTTNYKFTYEPVQRSIDKSSANISLSELLFTNGYKFLDACYASLLGRSVDYNTTKWFMTEVHGKSGKELEVFKLNFLIEIARSSEANKLNLLPIRLKLYSHLKFMSSIFVELERFFLKSNKFI